ncbi:ankyrin repeat-containing [Holotrichia oblita]|uniref:Ankyrin repeat-containing n=1 Tax=Holotrichia oblita TaxID=644536 RepID=A0ACB9SJP9_HOLOL|nr:ankyrin repeat-containing [Holotrichia oblita]
MVNYCFVFVAILLIGIVSPSAIPMWEYLTVDEKIMYLYNMFQSQVQNFCESNTCRQQLKNHGWNKLKNMSEDHLDKMDPFQRGSNDIIWESVMEGHEMASQMRPAKTTSTIKPDEMDAYYESIESSDASAQVESEVNKPVYKLPEDTLYTDGGYSSSNKIQDSATTEGIPIIENYGEYHRIPLTGPMVIKVHVDGTPVNDNQTLPEDEDLKQYQLTKTVYQNL